MRCALAIALLVATAGCSAKKPALVNLRIPPACQTADAVAKNCDSQNPPHCRGPISVTYKANCAKLEVKGGKAESSNSKRSPQ